MSGLNVGTSVRTPSSPCTNCGKVHNAATSVGKKAVRPSPNDFTICIKCGHLMVFGDDLKLRDLTDAEIIEAAGDERIIAIQRARQAVAAKR